MNALPLLEKLESWLETHLPEVADDLNPGATPAELERFAADLALQDLPDDFVQLYTWHNGQAGKVSAGPWYGLNFLPLDQVRQQCQSWRKMLQDLDENDIAALNQPARSTPEHFVQRQYAHALWIPFAHDCGGNHLGIDLCPDVQGTRGQVINFGRDEDRKIAIAPSIGAFVQWMLGELAAGNFSIEKTADGSHDFNTLRPRKYHFLDSLAEMFPQA